MEPFSTYFTPKSALLSGANSPNLNSFERFHRTMPPSVYLVADHWWVKPASSWTPLFTELLCLVLRVAGRVSVDPGSCNTCSCLSLALYKIPYEYIDSYLVYLCLGNFFMMRVIGHRRTTHLLWRDINHPRILPERLITKAVNITRVFRLMLIKGKSLWILLGFFFSDSFTFRIQLFIPAILRLCQATCFQSHQCLSRSAIAIA